MYSPSVHTSSTSNEALAPKQNWKVAVEIRNWTGVQEGDQFRATTDIDLESELRKWTFSIA